ncbi:hypothetical protein RHGRI_002786 [Rhododendron griersonianum]|uniref:GDSL esterase/lipase n=1 Tax=Rhododendron griersonianum TaxID=479676 RepID=A0AAV6LRJ7_9ERIC|nr:hypothetical protein RHGRI_002786 [Rhododendron griersonianum]
MSSSPFFLITILAAALAVVAGRTVVPPPQPKSARAFFVFGDSLVDNGNNNYLVTTARADSPPYGIDYPTHHPTGRFSNGLNLPDIISEQLGMEPTLPYLSPELTGHKLLVGANFASAGIGILNDTGFQFANIIRISHQLELFQCYQNRLKAVIGAGKAQQLVNGGLVLIVLGGNDFVNNYFLVPYSARRLQYPIPEFCQYLCAEEPERAAELFNTGLDDMVQGLNQQLGSDVFISVKAYMKLHKDFNANPQTYGFVSTKVACCGQGPYNGIGICNPASNLCQNRNSYVFWDPYHPTERANRYIVQQMLNGSEKYMHPMNLNTIMARASTN